VDDGVKTVRMSLEEEGYKIGGGMGQGLGMGKGMKM
jgi:hypothetical protein